VVSVPADALRRHEVTADDLDGIVEFPRSIAGVRMALLFRHIGNGRIKVSFRIDGRGRRRGIGQSVRGGGHHRAAGASLEARWRKSKRKSSAPRERSLPMACPRERIDDQN